MLRKSNCARPWDAAIEGRAWPREVLKTKVIEATVKENLMLGRSLDSINALLTPDQRRAFHKQTEPWDAAAPERTSEGAGVGLALRVMAGV